LDAEKCTSKSQYQNQQIGKHQGLSLL